MDVPGLSLFQGAESIQLNDDQPRIEEEQAEIDRLRRNEELKIELEKEFGDLEEESDDEDDTSISYDVANRKSADGPNLFLNGIATNHKDNRNQHNENELMNEILQLKNVLSSKNQELMNLTSEFKAERMNMQNKIDELSKRLTITDSDKERAIMSKHQLQELLVESKAQLSNRDEKISELNDRINTLDTHNLQLLAELERTKALLSDVQHKYHMVEKNAAYSSERHTDNMVKQINDRHAAQTDMLQQQINTMRTKLEDKEIEIKRLIIQNNELHKSRESMLLDKSDMINQLTKRLDEAQRQCQDMIAKSACGDDLSQENIRLMHKVTSLEEQTDEMKRTISSLTLRLNLTTSELEQLTETMINDDEAPGNDSPSSIGITETPLIRKAVGQPPRLAVSSTPLLVEDRLTRLKQEFNRCVADQRAKRMEITALKEELNAKNQQIDRLRADENHALIELTMSKENAERLAIRLKNMERELEEFKKNTNSENGTTTPAISDDDGNLVNRLRSLEQENDNFRMNCNHLNETIRGLEDERDSIEQKYRDACKDIAELQHKLSNLESNSCLECEKQKFLTKDAQQECTRLKELYIKIDAEKEDVLRKLRHLEAADLNKELLEQRNMVASLERSLQLAEMKYTETTKILEREKANQETHIQNLRAKYEQEMSNIESKELKDVSNSCRKCIDSATKISKLEIENLQLQTSCSGYLKDIHDLKKTIKKSEQAMADLSGKMILMEEHEQLIDNLKSKAKQFEEFMRNQSPEKSFLVDLVNSRRTNRVRDQCVSTEDLFAVETPRANSSCSVTGLDRSAERRIRDEMARAMAGKVKTIENEFKSQLLSYEQEIGNLSTEVCTLQSTLKEREVDISNLKKCILKERFEVKNIMKQKDVDHTEAMKMQHSVLVATKNELETSKQRIDALLNDLTQCRKEFQAERESAHKLMGEWKKELTTLSEREEMLTKQIQLMEADHKAVAQGLNEKFISAKKTALNYKKYSEEKEAHIVRESERIKNAYDAAVEKMKNEMKTIVKNNEKQTNKRIAEMQAQLDAVLLQQK